MSQDTGLIIPWIKVFFWCLNWEGTSQKRVHADKRHSDRFLAFLLDQRPIESMPNEDLLLYCKTIPYAGWPHCWQFQFLDQPDMLFGVLFVMISRDLVISYQETPLDKCLKSTHGSQWRLLIQWIGSGHTEAFSCLNGPTEMSNWRFDVRNQLGLMGSSR